jgi:hypothetical protein
MSLSPDHSIGLTEKGLLNISPEAGKYKPNQLKRVS